MPSVISVIPVGSDGHIPVIDTSTMWKIWAMHQMYTGTTGAGKYVGKPGDWVIDIANGMFYSIVSVDPNTAIPVFASQSTLQQNDVIDENDTVFGIGPGGKSDTQYVYFDDSVVPSSLITDVFVKIPGSDSSYARIFRGVNISDEAACVSRLYDQSNTLVDDKIPLGLAEQDNVTTTATYSVAPCNTTTPLLNGEKVTLVVYNNLGSPSYARQLIVVKTAFARSVNSSKKLIVNTSLKSPFVSASDPSLIQYPVNVPLAGLNLIGVVHYSDGSTREYPVNGSKFAITGYEYFAATKVDETFKVVLHYYPSDDEFSYVLSGGPTKHISKIYTCKVTRADGAYNIKLFGYPHWINPDVGYRFRWYVGNIERTILKDVTSFVRVNENIAGFNPQLYGVVQRIVASIYFDDINPAWRHVKHVQPMDVTLINPGTEYSGSNWSVSYNPNGSPVYGLNCHAIANAINANQWTLDLKSGSTNLTDWLTKFYYNTLPIKDLYTEIAPPAPTHFTVVSSAGGQHEFPISSWNSLLTIGTAVTNNDTLMVKFFKRTISQNAIYLSAVGIPVRMP